MITIIVMLFPALISYDLLLKIKKEIFSLDSFIKYFPLITVIILILNSLVLKLVFRHDAIVLINQSFTVSFVLKYCLLSLFWAIILPPVIYFFESNLELKMTLEQGEEIYEEKKN